MAIRQPGSFGVPRVEQASTGPTPTGVPPAVTGANIVELNVPQTVGVGGTATITGRVHYNNISRPLTNTPVRIQARGEGMTPISDQVDDLSHCNKRGFSIDVPAIGQAGDTMTVEVVSQSSPLTNWQDDETQGPFTIQILSPGEQAQKTALEFAPWAIGGGALGAGAASFTGRPLMPGVVLGAGVGVGARVLTQEGGIGGVIGVPRVNAVQAIALAALLGAGALFLGEVTDIGVPGVNDVRRRLPTRRSRETIA